MGYSLNTIRWENDCASTLDQIEAEYGTDAITGLEWSLNHEATEWLQVPGTTLYMARTRSPFIRAYFRFDGDIVAVIKIDYERL